MGRFVTKPTPSFRGRKRRATLGSLLRLKSNDDAFEAGIDEELTMVWRRPKSGITSWDGDDTPLEE